MFTQLKPIVPAVESTPFPTCQRSVPYVSLGLEVRGGGKRKINSLKKSMVLRPVNLGQSLFLFLLLLFSFYLLKQLGEPGFWSLKGPGLSLNFFNIPSSTCGNLVLVLRRSQSRICRFFYVH